MTDKNSLVELAERVRCEAKFWRGKPMGKFLLETACRLRAIATQGEG